MALAINIIVGIVSGIVASIVVIGVQFIKDYISRKRFEFRRIYSFDEYDIDPAAPPEYYRESHNSGDRKVKVSLPFDIREVKIIVKDDIVFEDRNVPANMPIYVLYYSDLENIAFILNCITTKCELRSYEYTMMYKYSGGQIGYGLKLVSQHFCFFKKAI